MQNANLLTSSEDLARKIRRDALNQIYTAGSGHPGGALSCADLLAVLFGEVLNYQSPQQDHFILSKGQSSAALYAAWAHTGLIPLEDLKGFRKLNHHLQGLPHVLPTPLAETSTGSLGQGFSVAVGMALGYRHQNNPCRIVTVLGDGELQAGIVWEAAMCAAHYQLGQLTAIIDYNKLQSDSSNDQVIQLEPLADKWRAFGWEVREIDGHNHEAIRNALNYAGSKPLVIIAHTIKGKGVSWMENIPAWHGSVTLTDEQIQSALEELA